MTVPENPQWDNRCNISTAFRKQDLGWGEGVEGGGEKSYRWEEKKEKGCHLHLAYLSFAQRQVIKFTLGLSEGPSDAVSAPKAVWQ